MNEFLSQYKNLLKQEWQSMDGVSKGLAVLISLMLVVGGLFTGLFVFSLSLVITLAVYLRCLWVRYRTNLE